MEYCEVIIVCLGLFNWVRYCEIEREDNLWHRDIEKDNEDYWDGIRSIGIEGGDKLDLATNFLRDKQSVLCLVSFS